MKQAQTLSCVDIDLNRGVSGRHFKNIFLRRGDEVSRALVSLRHPDRQEKGVAERCRVAPPRTGTAASGSTGAASKASIGRSIRRDPISGMSPSGMTAPREVPRKAAIASFREVDKLKRGSHLICANAWHEALSVQGSYCGTARAC
ncbi:MAG: hypothetical protein WBG11_07635 [Methylocella sp.]